MKKKIFTVIGVCTLLWFLNLGLYLARTQFVCSNKIGNNQSLNLYETASALQFHSSLWMFGWVVSPQTAYICFLKQFHIKNPIIDIPIPSDEKVEYYKKLAEKSNHPIRMWWRSYSSNASILLNGSYVSFKPGHGYSPIDFPYYEFYIHSDYKPGSILIRGIRIEETVMDYLENKGFLYNGIYEFSEIAK